MRICSPSVPRLKDEWNHTVGSVNNLRCGIAGFDGQPFGVLLPGPQELYLSGGTPAKGQSCQPLAMTTKVFGLLSAHSRLRSSPDCSVRPPGSIKKGAVFFVCLHVMTPRLQFGLGQGEPRNYSWECLCSDPVLLEQLTIVIGAPKC